MHQTESLLRSFMRYVSLNILSMIGLSCYILADTYFIANGVGSAGITALNLVLPVYSFINGVGLMLGMGAATWYAILRGEKEADSADRVFTHVLMLGVAAGIIFTVFGIANAGYLARLLGAEGNIHSLATVYLQTMLSFSCPFILNNIFVCFVRNDQNPGLAMTAMLAGSLLNILLDYILIFPLRLGMFGAAFATGLAPLVSMLILLVHKWKRKNQFHLVRCGVSGKRLLRILTFGFPSFITEFSSGVVILIFNMVILRLVGNTGVAAYGIIANMALVAVGIFTGVAQGIQPIVSTNYGMGNDRNIKKTFYYAVFLAFVLGACFYAAGLLFTEPIVSVFNGEQNADLAQMAEQGVRLYFLAFLIMGINIVAAAVFAALGCPVRSFVLSIMRGGAAIVPAIFLLAWVLGMTGVWLTIPCAEGITLLLTTLYSVQYFRTKKRGPAV